MKRRDHFLGRWHFIWRSEMRYERRWGLDLWGDKGRTLTLDLCVRHSMLTITKVEKE